MHCLQLKKPDEFHFPPKHAGPFIFINGNDLMLKTLFATAIAAVMAGGAIPSLAHAQQANTLTAQEKAQGWQLLFNGKNLDGWHSYLQKGPAKDWKIEDGAIMLERSRTGDEKDFADLVTDAEYSNFDLKLEWKMTPCADSGVMFYVHESPKYRETYETGPEMQIADLVCTKPDSQVLYERSGDLFDLISSDVERVHEAGNWNQFEIIADHGHIQFFQNGYKVVDTYFWNDDWRKLVARTKFAQWPDFGTFKTGHISLQGTEDKGELPIRLWFRNIKLRQL
ncbi:DUF1080 domain-containing protein [Dyella psychrodurans]|uniref:DUF1080 domain-containing protein n=2 Tax=Dyella psychrodurans TaxID=1927960 RepID=A0A370XDG1_9GAMM|nr:DUF1080 domain-containing protein [Dyella psychrodurans]